jgi:hypothetical protein
MEQFSPEEKVEFQRRIQRSADFQKVFLWVDGERVVKELDKFCGFKDDTFSSDPYISAYNAGRRAVSIFIHNILEQDVEKEKIRLTNLKENKQTE